MTNNIPREVVEQYRRAKEIGGNATARLTFVTGLAAHRTVETLRVQAITEGLEATHTHDGGVLERRHVLKVTGDAPKVVLFSYAATGKPLAAWEE